MLIDAVFGMVGAAAGFLTVYPAKLAFSEEKKAQKAALLAALGGVVLMGTIMVLTALADLAVLRDSQVILSKVGMFLGVAIGVIAPLTVTLKPVGPRTERHR